jgi:hypothetical protein
MQTVETYFKSRNYVFWRMFQDHMDGLQIFPLVVTLFVGFPDNDILVERINRMYRGLPVPYLVASHSCYEIYRGNI